MRSWLFLQTATASLNCDNVSWVVVRDPQRGVVVRRYRLCHCRALWKSCAIRRLSSIRLGRELHAGLAQVMDSAASRTSTHRQRSMAAAEQIGVTSIQMVKARQLFAFLKGCRAENTPHFHERNCHYLYT